LRGIALAGAVAAVMLAARGEHDCGDGAGERDTAQGAD